MNSKQDNNFDKLEAELRSFRPAPLNAGLKDRIISSANTAPMQIHFRRLALYAAAAAAVVLIALGLLFMPRPETASTEVAKTPAVTTNVPSAAPKITIYRSAPQRILKPVSCNTTLVAQREVGPATNSPSGPSQTIHRRYIDQYEWYDESHDTVYTTRKPRDSFVVVPVSSY